MLELLIAVLVIAWLFGFVGYRRAPQDSDPSGLFHLLLIVALILFLLGYFGHGFGYGWRGPW